MQRTEPWFNDRRNKLTASNIGALLGLCNYTSRTTALRRARGLDDFCGNDATRYGTMMEGTVLEVYEQWKKKKTHADGFRIHPCYDWFGGSPDGLVGEEGIVEIKCPYNQHWVKLEGNLSLSYYMQCQTLLWSYGREWLDFVMYAGPLRGCSVRRVTVDWSLLHKLLPIMEKIMQDVREKRGVPRSINSPKVKEWVAQSQLFHVSLVEKDIL